MKRDFKLVIERFKARLVIKGYTKRETIDYSYTFFAVSSKDSFRIIISLTSCYNLELHKMDVKIVFF